MRCINDVSFAAQSTFSVLCKRVEIALEKDGNSFGFTLRGGANPDPVRSRPLIVTQIRPGSSADRSDGWLFFLIVTSVAFFHITTRIFFKKVTRYIFELYILTGYQNHAGGWNSPLWKAKACLSFKDNALVADDLVTQRTKEPTHTIFAENILFSTSGPFC